MYKLFTANSKTRKRLRNYLNARKSIANMLDRLRQNPMTELGAHRLHGRLKGKWGCWLGANIRMIYSINEEEKIIIVEAVGTHKIY